MKGIPVPSSDPPIDRLVDDIYRMIRKGELSPGEHVDQRSVASLLSVSRTPLREALRALAADGVLTHSRNQGYVVTKMNAANMLELYSLRAFLESELARSIEWPSEEHIDKLRVINERTRAGAASGDVEEIVLANREFYFEIFSWSPLQVFFVEAKRIWRISEPYRAAHFARLGRHQRLGDLHDEVIQAIIDRDRALLLSLMDARRATTFDALRGDLDTAVTEAHILLPQTSTFAPGTSEVPPSRRN